MFISYAQNFEDVILWRALDHVATGFYIDVGAMDPALASVTKAFYDRGWHGINIEPIQHWYARLCAERIHDANIQTAIGERPGKVRVFEVPNTGNSTLVPSFARHYRAQGVTVNETEVDCRTLTDICDAYHVTEVHFLKIDVEGSEGSVLRGFDLGRYRPWIILVESADPLSTTSNHTLWDGALLSREYEFAYWDGLNRFYVAREHGDLIPKLAIPPNVFDAFVSSAQVRAEAIAATSRDELSLANQRLNASAQIETRLQAMVEQVLAQMTHLQQTSDDRVRTIDAERLKAQAQVDLVSQELDGSRSRCDGLVGQLQRVRDDAARQAERLQTALHDTQAQLDSARSQVDELSSSLHASRVLTDALQSRVSDLQSQLESVRRSADDALASVAADKAKLTAIQTSHFWRLTAPLRRLTDAVKSCFPRRAGARVDGLMVAPTPLPPVVNNGRLYGTETSCLTPSTRSVLRELDRYLGDC